MADYILAHDIGTSGDKASLFRTDGVLEQSVTVPYETVYSRRGWAEQNACDWWRAVCESTRRLMTDRDPKEVKAIGISGQMMGCLPLDKDGQPLMPCIIWSDSRAEEESRFIENKLTVPYINRHTGQPLSPTYPLPKIMWLKEHHPDVMDKARVFLQAKDYINYCLTGELYTDITDAAYTLAFDIGKRAWSEEILKAVDIPASVFPKVAACETIIGTVTKKAAEACGLVPGIPVVASAGDGSAAHMGGRSIYDGDAYLCLGTSTWIQATTAQLVFDSEGRMQSEPHVVNDVYAYLGTMQAGGLAHRWAIDDMLGGRDSYADIDALASQSDPGSDGVIFMPYLMGERSPWYDTEVNAAFLGMRLQTGKPQMMRAVMEGVGFNLKILLDLIRRDVSVKELVLIGGGARSRIWKQILADIFDVPIQIPYNVEAGTSLGAAMIAGVGCGLFKDYSVIKEMLPINETIEPCRANRAVYDEEAEIFVEAYHALKPVNHRIAKLLEGE